MTDGLQYLIGSSIYITSAAQFTGIVEYGFQIKRVDFQFPFPDQHINVFRVVHDFYIQQVILLESFVTDRAGGNQYISL